MSNLPLFSLSQKLSHQNGITNPPNIKSCLKSPYFKSKLIFLPESPEDNLIIAPESPFLFPNIS